MARGVGKPRFQQSATTCSGTGEKETLNINVVGKKRGKTLKLNLAITIKNLTPENAKPRYRVQLDELILIVVFDIF